MGVEELHRASRLASEPSPNASTTRAFRLWSMARSAGGLLLQQFQMALGHSQGLGRQRLGRRGEAERVDALFQVADALLRAIDGFLQEKVDSQIVRVGEFDREVAVIGQAARFEDVLTDAFGQRVLPGDDLLDRLHDVLAARRNVRPGVEQILRERALEDLQHAVENVDRIG